MKIRFLFALCISCHAALAFMPSSLSRFGGGGGRNKNVLSMSIPDPIDTFTSGLASICRLPGGVTIIEKSSSILEAERPQLKQLYDVENSRTCRQVREKITELDLVVKTVIPAASNSRAFTEPGYKYSLPEGTSVPRLVLVDSSGNEVTLSGADEICSYLDAKFSVDAVSDEDTKERVIAVLRELGGYLAGFLRSGRGMNMSPAAGAGAPRPKKPLVLYSYEGNQFCRLVREVLTELDIVYELRSAGKMSPRRKELADITGGSTICPYLLDPNTDVSMAESADIIRYLYKTYALWQPPNELLQWASGVIIPPTKPLFALLTPIQAGSSDKEDDAVYAKEIAIARSTIEAAVKANPVVVYTYGLSPFSLETKTLLESLGISYEEISLGDEWIPGLIAEGGSQTRAAFLEMTGQSSLPHIFIGGKSIGGLFSGTPGLVSALEQGKLLNMVSEALAANTDLEAPVLSQ